METHSLLPEEQSERNSDLGLEDDEKTSEILGEYLHHIVKCTQYLNRD